MNINQRIENLRTQWSTFRLIDTKAKPGCLESGNFSTWQCCDFHKQAEKQDSEMTNKAVEITLILLPGAQQYSEVSSMVVIGGDLMSVLSIRWWELIDEAVEKNANEGGDR